MIQGMNRSNTTSNSTGKALLSASLRRGRTAVILTPLLALIAITAWAAPLITGTFVTPTQSGSLSYTPVRAFRGGSEGNFVVGGRRYPGSMYAAVGGGTGLVWYYGVSGLMAGNALVTVQPDGSKSGPIWFFDRRGNTIDAGTLTLR